jgi:hypothetical protein
MELRETECWREIENTNGLYFISSHGRVKRRKSLLLEDEYIVRHHVDFYGYLRVGIRICEKWKTIPIHRLVGIYFVPNPDNRKELNHRFGDKADNYYKHLEWCTRQENILHAYAFGLNKYHPKNWKVKSKPVIQCDLEWNEIRLFPSVMEVARTLKIRHSNIVVAVKNKRTSHGFRWKYQVNSQIFN